MYFSTELFVKRGPLGHLWLAGTVFHKLSKKVILSCNVPEMCDSIKQPPIPLALPARAQLFLGVCRIIDKQAKYLLIDATEAQSRVQLAVTTSSVNLSVSRAQAKSDTINIVCDFDDFVLPPIPLDCFENILDKETALFLPHSNPEDLYFTADHNLLDHNHLDLNSSLPPHDGIVGLEKTLFDPLAIMDDNDAPDIIGDLNPEILPPDDDVANGNLPEITVDDLDRRRLSQASVHSKATADTFNVSVISRKRKRNRPKPDSKIDISINVLKHELADTSRIVTVRPKPLRELAASFDQQDPLRCIRSAMIYELSDALQSCYENESHRELFQVASAAAEFDYDQPPFSPERFRQTGGATDEILSFKSGNISIERARRESVRSSDENQHPANTFLGHEMRLRSPSANSFGSDVKSSPQQMRRVSMKSMGSLDSRTRHLGSINEVGVSDFQTPNLDLTISQFDIPHVEVNDDYGGDRPRRNSVDRATEILRSIIDEHFKKIDVTEGNSKTCQFHSVIEAAVGPNVRISRRDAALSFLQLLVLKTINMVDIEQTEPYGPINIVRTPSFSLSFPNSEVV